MTLKFLRSLYSTQILLLVLLLTPVISSSVSASLNTPVVSISYVTYFGGSNIEEVSTTACREDGSVAIVGHCNSQNLPVSEDAFQKEFRGGDWDIFVAMFSITGELEFCTYLGGSAREHVDSVAFDNSGNVIVAGLTRSEDFPVTSNALQTEHAGESDGFLVAISDNGSTLLYGTYFGGNSSDSIEDIIIDQNGNYLFSGTTSSAGLATEGAYQSQPQGGEDVFVAKLSYDGGTLQLFSYIGGITTDRLESMVIDSSHNFILSGLTRSSDFPTTSEAFQTDYSGSGDAFLTKVSRNGSSLEWSTFIGGTDEEYGRGVDVDSFDNIVVTGETQSLDLETFNAVQSDHGGGTYDAFVCKCTPEGLVQFLSYLGGNQFDLAYDVKFDINDRPIVVGRTLSDDFPLQNPFQSNRTGHLDLTITELSTDGQSVVMSSYFGGSAEDSGESISISSDGLIILTGRTASPDLPCSNNAFRNEIGGSYDAFLCIMSVDLQSNLVGPIELLIVVMIGGSFVVIVLIIWKKNH